jgi:antitoxin PrlF
MRNTREQVVLNLEDPAIGNHLRRLEEDVEAGRNVRALPEDLVRAMLANLGHAGSFDEEIEGDVAL